MSDVSQGPGWWQASDDKWYPPEQHPGYRPPPPPPTDTGTSPQSVSAAGPAPQATLLTSGRMTRLRWINVAAIVGGAVGLLMAWGTAFIVSVTGLDTDDGKLFGAILIIAALLFWWRVMRTNRLNGSLLIVVWLGLLAIGVYEIVHISSSHLVSVGSGVYVDTAAAAIGLLTVVMDTQRHWSKVDGQRLVSAAALSTQPTTFVATDAPPQTETGEPAPLVRRSGGAHTGESAGSKPVRRKWWLWTGSAVVIIAALCLLFVSLVGSKSVTGAPLPYTDSGSTSGDTAQLAVTDNSWRLKWSYVCPASANIPLAADGIGVYINGGPENGNAAVDDFNSTSSGSGQTKAYYGTGTISLSVSTPCNWTVTVIQP